MATLANFIPSNVLGAFILDKLDKVLVAGDVVNTTYNGVISAQGDSVKIPSLGDITASAYTKGQTISYTSPDSAGQTLNIDQGYIFSYVVDAVDNAQSALNLVPVIADKGAYQLSKAADTYLLQTVMPSGALTVGGTGTRSLGTGSTPITVNAAAPSATNTSGVLSYLGRLSQRLDEADVPQEDRFCIVPSWFGTYITMHKLALPYNSSEDVYANGRVGRVMGFDVRVSNNVTNATTTGSHIFAGHRSAVAFADNLVDSTIIPVMETKAGTGIRGVYVYGAKVIQGNALAFGVVSQG